MSEPLLEAVGIVKQYGHVQALAGADFTAYPNEVVALVGDNGAGKSTLVKVLAGVVSADAGDIALDGQRITPTSPGHVQRLGIETVYQDLALAPELSPAANLYLGREMFRRGLLGRVGILDHRQMNRGAEQAFARLGVRLLNSADPVSRLSGGQRQSVAVARAATWASKLILLDEPTAALGVVQTRRVLDLIRRVRDSGTAVVLISHNMPDVLAVADRIEVLRLGRRVARFIRRDVTVDQLVGAMTGAASIEEASA